MNVLRKHRSVKDKTAFKKSGSLKTKLISALSFPDKKFFEQRLRMIGANAMRNSRFGVQ